MYICEKKLLRNRLRDVVNYCILLFFTRALSRFAITIIIFCDEKSVGETLTCNTPVFSEDEITRGGKGKQKTRRVRVNFHSRYTCVIPVYIIYYIRYTTKLFHFGDVLIINRTWNFFKIWCNFIQNSNKKL